jgi:predicted alpha/beta-fold hydrolase
VKHQSDGFRSAWWLPGPHAQTLGARLLRPGGGVTIRRERLELDDGDFLDLDWVEAAAGWRPGEDSALVLVLHGLEGSSGSDYALEMHRALAREGLASVGLNFRSCSGEPNRLPRFYHSGETGDVGLVLNDLARRFPGRPLGGVGFSLGGNVLLKYLGEHGSRPVPITAAAAISVPFDLAAGLAKLESGFSRVYQHYLLRQLRRKVELKAETLQGHVDVAALARARSLRQFDDLGTAPLHGFSDGNDYYARSSSKGFLDGIRIPTLLVHAVDDPFLPAEAVPHGQVEANPHLEAEFTSSGGHVGFVGGYPWAPVFWAERTAARFLAGRLGVGG